MDKKKERLKYLKPLGISGVTQLFLVRDIESSKYYVEKSLSANINYQGELFRNEIEMHSQFQHNYIIGFIKKTGDYKFLMEYAAKGNLENLLGTEIDEKLCIKYSIQFLKGLSYMHEAGFVHNDIKPSNIVITKDERAKLTDFAFSGKLNDSFTNMPKGFQLGTDFFRWPGMEQDSSNPLNHIQNDIYASGVVLYLLFSKARQKHSIKLDLIANPYIRQTVDDCLKGNISNVRQIIDSLSKQSGKPATCNDSLSACCSDLLNKLKIGVTVLNYQKRKFMFTNNHFSTLARDNEAVILKNVLLYLDLKKTISIRSDMRLDKSIIGFTIYKLSEMIYLTFFSDISYKKIYLENREENYFYEKLTHLAAEIVHEIGNPLTSLTTTLQVLDQGLDTWGLDKKREYIHRAVNEIERLSKYLIKMRNFSTVNIAIDKSTIRLKNLIDNVVIRNQAMLDNKKIKVLNEVDTEIQVVVDEDILYQVLLNLFLNSIDILPEEGKIWIKVDEITEFYVKLLFRNNGPTIPREKMERIFMPFYTTKKEGMGIGLAVSLKLMIRMGGRIQAELPEDGKGTKFVMYIPVLQ